ncbi:MAG: peptidoglycan bridge formation glycyltransferase FemA/FemB family protein [Bacilli bacterium]|nr:peptidoglycan bridge formation glycyltransferase FemA/FemB family protein [Bacilli bacterium]
MKIVKLNPAQFDRFASNHRYRNYYQTSMYGSVMSKFGYRCQYLGVVNEYNKLIGASLVIYKEVWRKNKIAYAPRGFLFNYEDKEQTEELASLLKRTLGKQNFMLMRMDPFIPLSVRDTEGNIMNTNDAGNDIIHNLEDAGFDYLGKNLYFETEKPRWEALVMLQRDVRDIFARLDKRTRNKIRKAKGNGLVVVKDESQNINRLYQYVGKKDHKPLSFYREMVNNFGKDIDIFYAKLRTESYIVNSRRNYEKEQEYNDNLAERIQDISLDPKEREAFLNKKMESDKLITAYKNSLLKATDLLKQRPEGIIVAGAMVIKYDNAAYIFTEGVDSSYSAISASTLMKWQLIETYNEQGFKYINLNAIVGDFENKNPKKNPYIGLNESKLGFNATVTEYIGEFDIVLNSFSYNLYKKVNKE